MNEFEQRVEHFIALRTRAADTINAMVEMELVSADEESRTMTLRFPLRHWEMNPVGRTHGGILCTLLDMAMGGIAYACSDADFTPTIQMSVNFVKGSETGEDLYVEAVCDHCGSRMLMTRAVARLKPGDVVATAVGSYANNKKRQNREINGKNRQSCEHKRKIKRNHFVKNSVLYYNEKEE